jgi:putative DNA primase/helicase
VRKTNTFITTDKTFANMTQEESQATCAKARHELRKEKQEPTAVVKAFSKIEEKSVSWLWHERIPINMLTLYVGDPGLGKSSLSLDLAARLSRGLPFPDGSPCPLGDTLILAGEDVPGTTIKPRLVALGADMERIHILLGKRDKNGYDDVTLFDRKIFEDAIDQIKANGGDLKLFVIDPFESFLGNIDAYRNTEVRQALRGIISLAEYEQFSVLGIQHLTKKNGIDAIHRIGGSIAFAASARTIWLIAKDLDDPCGCLFLHLKTNIGRKMPGFHYSIITADNGSGIVAWGKPADNNPNDVLNALPVAKQAPEQEKILEIIKSSYPQPVKIQEIVAATEKSKTAIANILKKLEVQGMIKKSSLHGFYELVADESSCSLPLPIGEGGEHELCSSVHQSSSSVVNSNDELLSQAEELGIY